MITYLKSSFGFNTLNKLVYIVGTGKFKRLMALLTDDVVMMPCGADDIARVALGIINNGNEFKLSEQVERSVDADQPQIAALRQQLGVDLLRGQRQRRALEQFHDAHARLRNAISIDRKNFLPAHCFLIEKVYQ